MAQNPDDTAEWMRVHWAEGVEGQQGCQRSFMSSCAKRLARALRAGQPPPLSHVQRPYAQRPVTPRHDACGVHFRENAEMLLRDMLASLLRSGSVKGPSAEVCIACELLNREVYESAVVQIRPLSLLEEDCTRNGGGANFLEELVELLFTPQTDQTRQTHHCRCPVSVLDLRRRTVWGPATVYFELSPALLRKAQMQWCAHHPDLFELLILPHCKTPQALIAAVEEQRRQDARTVDPEPAQALKRLLPLGASVPERENLWKRLADPGNRAEVFAGLRQRLTPALSP